MPTKICLYCATSNPQDSLQCSKCGMALAEQDLQDRKRKIKPFIVFFIALVVFCVFMMVYLPRSVSG